MKLLLHVCCAPCLLGCIDKVCQDYKVTCYFYNPNIFPLSEHEKRLEEVKKAIKEHFPKTELIVESYSHDEFTASISGLENEKEGGVRCENCIDLRLSQTAKYAKANGFDCFDSTLSVSPHKNYKFIKKVGETLQTKLNISYLGIDFKKQDGFLTSTRLSKQFGIYRQDYCGCEFSLKQR